MFKFLKKKKSNIFTGTSPEPAVVLNESDPIIAQTKDASKAEGMSPQARGGFFARLKQGLAKTRASFVTGISNLLLGKKQLDPDVLKQIETLLLSADVGVALTQQFIDELTQNMSRSSLQHAQSVLACLQTCMLNVLAPCAVPLLLECSIKPYVILVVGVNGSGKTTLIAKLARSFQTSHYKVMLAAGDTFRAAAIDQLAVWGERHAIPVIAQQPGADTAAVIYDAMTAARARGIDVLIADTAGRLQTQTGLMAELHKVKRVLGKLDSSAPHETLLVLDAGIGQNTLNQVREFHQAIGVTGLALTKLDGTARGGIIFAIAKQTGLPIRYLGVGEQADDLRAFKAEEFIEALFSDVDKDK